MSTKMATVYAVLVVGVGILEACSKEQPAKSPVDLEAHAEQVVSDANAQIINCHNAHMQAQTSLYRYKIVVQCLPNQPYSANKARYE